MVPVTKARVKVWTYCIVAIPAMIAYLILRGDNKTKLKMDINRFWLHLRGKTPSSGWQYIAAFYYLMCGIREFRNVFYMRLGYSSLLISWLMPEMVEFSFATPSRFVGGGGICTTWMDMCGRCGNCGRKSLGQSKCHNRTSRQRPSHHR